MEGSEEEGKNGRIMEDEEEKKMKSAPGRGRDWADSAPDGTRLAGCAVLGLSHQGHGPIILMGTPAGDDRGSAGVLRGCHGMSGPDFRAKIRPFFIRQMDGIYPGDEKERKVRNWCLKK